ncbi:MULTISPECIES: hypothetical protein [Sporosarcina]|uniref:hypothetical protein n=1 Tax=Sporosarcina TaxID=1569 RepID=UPI00203CC55B|nr:MULTISPECIES: hypothetical protein [Sporosarcina]MCM3711068.1 hypothetical protein [Sporosarcina luteola]
MKDEQFAIEVILKFLRDENRRTLLVKGYDNDAKLRVVLSCLNKVFDKGIIRTSSMGDISDFINVAFNKKLLPYKVKSTTNYKIGRMTINFSGYANHTKSNPRGNEGTFTLYYPIQTVLDDRGRYAKLLNELDETDSGKIILVTTNEWSIKEWDIESHMDEVFFYSVENDNPEIMKNLRRNGAI